MAVEAFEDIEPIPAARPPITATEAVAPTAVEPFEAIKPHQVEPFETIEPISEQPQLEAAPPETAIGRVIGRAREYIRGKTGLFEPPIYGETFREEKPLSTIVGAGGFYGAKSLSQLGLYVPDIIVGAVSPYKSLAEAVNKLTGFKPTEKEIKSADAVAFLGGLQTAGGITGELVHRIAARAALKKILGTGLTFATRRAAEELADKFVKNDPIELEGIWFEGGLGAVFGAGEVGLQKLTDFIKSYRAGTDIQLSKLPPESREAARRAAREEIQAALDKYRTTGDRTDWERVRNKYMGLSKVTPPQAVAPTEPLAAEAAIRPSEAPPKPPIAVPPAESPPVTPSQQINVFTAHKTLQEVRTYLTDKLNGIKAIPKIADFYTGRAADTIEKHYGRIPAGQTLARDTREIVFQADNRAANRIRDFEDIIKGLTEAERIELGRAGQLRLRKISPKLEQINQRLLEFMDVDMADADAAGYRRLLGDQWHHLKGTGGWFPQHLNDRGRDIINRAMQKGLGDPKVMSTAERMVAEGKAETPQEALSQLLDWYNHNLRGTAGYFERPRTLLPEDMVELDIAKVVPYQIRNNAKMIVAAKQWGVGFGEEPVAPEYNLFGEIILPEHAGRLDFIKAREMIGEIAAHFGRGDAEALKKWIRTEFGLSNDLPETITNTINAINNYETVARLGFRLPSAVRNLTQGNVNLFTAPLRAHIKANEMVLFKRWSQEAQKLYEQVRRSGAVGGLKEMAELEKTTKGEKALKLFTAAETSNQIRAALIARFSAEDKIKDLAKLQNATKLQDLLLHLKYLSVNPEDYLRRVIRERTFTNPITDAEVDALWRGEKQLTLEDYARIMHRASVDTQFINNFASRPIPWKTNPFLRLGLKFKTFAINQTRLIYQEAVKEAMKGHFAPLAKYFLLSAIGGELYNIIRDLLMGQDQSLLAQLLYRPEKHNLPDIVYGLLNDFVDGAGVGILTDMTYGVGNWLFGPAVASGKNVLEWASNIKHPIIATRKFLRNEIAVMRDLEGLMARADALFINENNKFFEYQRWRDRAFDWAQQKERPTVVKRAGKVVTRILGVTPRYPTLLPYEFAAKQITFGDIDDAADYLAEQIRVDDRPKQQIRESMEESMKAFAPLGRVPSKDMYLFLQQFPVKEREAALQLHREWIKNYRKAIDMAFQRTGK